jgi:catalase
MEGVMIKTTAAALAAVLTLAIPAVSLAQATDVNTQIVDAMNKLYGVHPGFRANHAKGVVVEGTFRPSAEAAALSKSPLFSGGTVPVTVRFSDAGGVPNIPDGSPQANPHGMAIKYHLAGGVDTDMVINSLKTFVVATPEDFLALNVALAGSAPGQPPSPQLGAFLQSHPSVGKALSTLGTPDSFADEQYNGINAFIYTNKAGKKQAIRYIVTPEKIVHLDKDAAAKQAPDYLVNEIGPRLAKGPVTFHVKAQLAAAGDQTKDGTQAWPDDRKVVDLGTLTLTKAVANSEAVQKTLLFIPGRLTDGIEFSDDPILPARDGAYAVSFGRRSATP